MDWQSISLDNYADYQAASGASLRRAGETWWMRVAPFFFRPLNPLTRLRTRPSPYPLEAWAGGAQHAVADVREANSYINFYVYEDLQSYDLSQLNDRRRRETRRSIEQFTARRITDLEEFVSKGHPIYQEFFRRTGYKYRKERVERSGFERWARALFAHPEMAVLGVYHRGQLVAADVSYRMGGVIFDDTFFSNDASLRMHVTNFVVHALRTAAAQSDATWLCRGAPTTSPSLDHSKQRRGCRLVALPAVFRANPIALLLVRAFYQAQYRRLLGIESAGLKINPAKSPGVRKEVVAPAPRQRRRGLMVR